MGFDQMFEKCVFCGKQGMRSKNYLAYNQSQDVFYLYNKCIFCGELWHEEVSPEDMENAECKKQMCIACQEWNKNIRNVDEINMKNAGKRLFYNEIKRNKNLCRYYHPI